MDASMWDEFDTGLTSEAAKSKRPVADAPTQQRMKADIRPAQQRKPTADQKRVRRQMARQAISDTREPLHCDYCGGVLVGDYTTAGCSSCGKTFDLTDHGDATRAGLLDNEVVRIGVGDVAFRQPISTASTSTASTSSQTSTTTTKESSTMTQHQPTEQDLIQRLARATTLVEQSGLQIQLENLRTASRESAAREGSLDWDSMGATPPSRMQAAASRLVAGDDALPPMTASTRLGHSDATDWLADLTPTETADPTLSAIARAEATQWFNGVWAPVKQDRQEFTAQAHNAAARSASQFGLQATAAASVFVDQVRHLASREGLSLVAFDETVDTYVSDGKTTQPVGVSPSTASDSMDEWTIGTDLNGGTDPKSTNTTGEAPSLKEGDTPEQAKGESLENPNFGEGPDKSEWAVGNTDDKMSTQGSIEAHMAAEFGGYGRGIETHSAIQHLAEDSTSADGRSSADAATEAPSMAEGGPVEGDHAESYTQEPPAAQDASSATPHDNLHDVNWTAAKRPAPLHSLASIGSSFEGKPVSTNTGLFAQALARSASLNDSVGGVSIRAVASTLAKSPEVPLNIRLALNEHLAGDSATVGKIPACDFCGEEGKQTPAIYDGKTSFGPWANMCERHFEAYGSGLGTGRGQRLVLGSKQASQTCSVCGDAIASDGDGYHHDNGEKHDHEAKPGGSEGGESKEGQRAPFAREAAAPWPMMDNPNFPGEQMPSCPKCGASVVMEGTPGPSGIQGREGGGTTLICGNGHRSFFPKDAAKVGRKQGGLKVRAYGEYRISRSCMKGGDGSNCDGSNCDCPCHEAEDIGETTEAVAAWHQKMYEDYVAYDPAYRKNDTNPFGGYPAIITEGSRKQAGSYAGGSPKHGDTAKCHKDGKSIEFFDGAWYHLNSDPAPNHNDVHPGTPKEVADGTAMGSKRTAADGEVVHSTKSGNGEGALCGAKDGKVKPFGANCPACKKITDDSRGSGDTSPPEPMPFSSSLTSAFRNRVQANLTRVAFDWDGAGRWIQSDLVKGEDVAKSSQSGPGGEKRPGYVWVEYDLPAKDATKTAGGDFSLTDAQNDEGEWIMSPEQIRAEMNYEPDPYDEADDFYRDAVRHAASKTASGSTYQVKKVHADTWLDGGESTEEAGEVIKANVTGDEEEFWLVRNNFNGAVNVYAYHGAMKGIDSSMPPRNMGSYQQFYGQPYREASKRTAGKVKILSRPDGIAGKWQVRVQSIDEADAQAKIREWEARDSRSGRMYRYKTEPVSGS